MAYTKQDLLNFIQKFVDTRGTLPNRRTIRELGISDGPFYKHFDSFTAAVEQFAGACAFKEYMTTTTPDPQTQNTTPKSPRGAAGATDSFGTVYYDDHAGEPIPQPPKDVKDALLDQLKQNLSVDELKSIVSGTGVSYTHKRNLVHEPNVSGYFKCIVTGDSHMGHNQFRQDWWDAMIDRGIEANVEWMYHTGDILEGMSGRDGHIFELAGVGFENQFAIAKKNIGEAPFPVRGIIGNHDLWYAGKANQGINVGVRLAAALPNFTFLGEEEADETVANVKIKLWHGRDGSSYAYSYRTQKFVEMLSGGEKPNILLSGHAHKSIFYETRNVHVFETGTTCGQTGFMRGKKLPAHTGFWIMECWTNENGLVRIRPEWTPFY